MPQLSILFFVLLNVFGSHPSFAESVQPKSLGPIVSGSLASDEILVELFRDRSSAPIVLSPMADNPTYSNIVEAAAKIPRRWHNSAESLIAMKPQLVILAAYNNPTLKARLTQTRIPFIELQKFDRLSDIRDHIKSIGAAVHQEAAAQKLLKQFDEEMVSLQKMRPSGSDRPSLISYSSTQTPGGTGTLIDDMITIAGGINLAGKSGLSGWSKLNAEVLAAMQPDFIIVAIGEKSAAEATEQIGLDPLWKHMRAVKEKKYIFINQTNLLSVSHHVLKAVEALQKQMIGQHHGK